MEALLDYVHLIYRLMLLLLFNMKIFNLIYLKYSSFNLRNVQLLLISYNILLYNELFL